MEFKSMLKTMAGVAGGIFLFKTMINYQGIIEECKEMYERQIDEHYGTKNTSKRTIQPDVDIGSLKKDASTALVNLGYKARDSKEKVNIAVTKGGCNTVEDIIKYVLQNSSNS